MRALTHVYGRLRPVHRPAAVLRPAAQRGGAGPRDQGDAEGGGQLPTGGPLGQELRPLEEGEGDGGGPPVGQAGDPRPEGLVELLHGVGQGGAGHQR